MDASDPLFMGASDPHAFPIIGCNLLRKKQKSWTSRPSQTVNSKHSFDIYFSTADFKHWKRLLRLSLSLNPSPLAHEFQMTQLIFSGLSRWSGRICLAVSLEALIELCTAHYALIAASAMPCLRLTKCNA